MKKPIQTDTSLYVLVVLSLLSTIASVVFGILDAMQVTALFHNSMVNVSEKYRTEATPPGWVFTIWPLIYLWILAGSFYLFASIFTRPNQSPVNHVPTLTPKTFLIATIIGPLAAVVWLFTFDHEMLIPSFVLLLISVASLWEAVRTSLKIVHDNLEQLEIYSRTMLLIMRILIHNGLALFATWTSIATVLGFAVSFIYVDSPDCDRATLRGIVNVEDGSSIALAVLLVVIVGLFVLENLIYADYFRYVFSVFPVFIFALTGLVVKLSATPDTARNLKIATVELGISVLCMIVRIVFYVIKLFPPKYHYLTKSSAKAALLKEEI